MRGWVADRKESSIERKEGVCAKEWKVESGSNPVTLWGTSSRT